MSSERIQTIKNQTLERIAEITASQNPTYKVDGEEVKKAEYLKQLSETVDWCNEQLQIENPFEIQTQGLT